MQTVALLFLTPLLCSAFVLGLIKIAKRFSILSIQDFRRLGQERVPLLGGVAIFLSFAITLKISGFAVPIALIVSAIPIALAGLIDDCLELSASPKFFVQIAAITLFLAWDSPSHLLLAQAGVPTILAQALTGFWILGAINAFNFIDGRDGLAGSVACIIASSLFILSATPGTSLYLLVLTCAVLGFLAFNFSPARIYLGDSGSTTLGFLLAASAATVPLDAGHSGDWWIALFLFAHPCADAILAMVRRRKIKQSVFSGDRDHLHHKLEKIGLSRKQSLLLMIAVNIYCALTALMLVHTPSIAMQWVVGGLSTVAMCTLIAGVYFLEKKMKHFFASYARQSIRLQSDLAATDRSVPTGIAVGGVLTFDLLSYCQDLYDRDLAHLDQFVVAVFAWAKQIRYSSQVQASEDGRLKIQTARHGDLTGMIQELSTLLKAYKVARNSDSVPSGLEILSSSIHNQDFKHEEKSLDHDFSEASFNTLR